MNEDFEETPDLPAWVMRAYRDYMLTGKLIQSAMICRSSPGNGGASIRRFS